MYPTPLEAVDNISHLLLDLFEHKYSPLDVFQEMYAKYPPFRYSLENKVTKEVAIPLSRISLHYLY